MCFLACSSGNFSCWLYSEHSGEWEKMSMQTASEVVIGNSLSIPDKGIYFFASNSTDNSSTGLLLKYRLVSYSLNFIFINRITGWVHTFAKVRLTATAPTGILTRVKKVSQFRNAFFKSTKETNEI